MIIFASGEFGAITTLVLHELNLEIPYQLKRGAKHFRQGCYHTRLKP